MRACVLAASLHDGAAVAWDASLRARLRHLGGRGGAGDVGRGGHCVWFFGGLDCW